MGTNRKGSFIILYNGGGETNYYAQDSTLYFYYHANFGGGGELSFAQTVSPTTITVTEGQSDNQALSIEFGTGTPPGTTVVITSDNARVIPVPSSYIVGANTTVTATLTFPDNNLVDEDEVVVSVTLSIQSTEATLDGNTLDVVVTVRDNDLPSITLDGTSLPANEGDSGSFSVAIPTGAVSGSPGEFYGGPSVGNVVTTIKIVGLHPSAYTLASNLLTFTGGSTGNWETAQDVGLTVHKDMTISADKEIGISVAVVKSRTDSTFYNKLTDTTFSIFPSITENDEPGFIAVQGFHQHYQQLKKAAQLPSVPHLTYSHRAMSFYQ